MTHSDQFYYVEGARNILAGNGYAVGIPPEPPTPMVHFPPLCSMTYAAGGLFFADIYEAVKWVNVLCFGGSVFLLGMLARSSNPRRDGSLIAALLFASNPLLLGLHTFPMSEPLFILLGLGGCLALVRFASDGRCHWIVISALLFGLTVATRYSGVVWIAVGFLAILFFSRSNWLRRCGNAAIFSAIAVLPMLAVIIRNHNIGGNALNRQFGFHVITQAHLVDGLHSVASWFLPWRLTNSMTGGLLVFGFSVLAIIAFVWCYRFKKSGGSREEFSTLYAAMVISLAFMILYSAHLVVAISFLHINTPLSARILAPLQITLMALIGIMISLTAKKMSWKIFVGIFLSIILFSGFRTGAVVRHNRVAGYGYRTTAWETDPIIAEIRKLPESAEIYSNRPEAIYLLTSRPVRKIPQKYSAMSQKENLEAAEQIEAMVRQLKNYGGVIVHFRPPQRDVQYESKDKSQAPLSRIHEFRIEEIEKLLPITKVMEGQRLILFRLRD